jgi:heme A synthase
MPSFRTLTRASIAVTLVLVAVGGLVRATDSGLGCGDDWPGCNGRLIPVLNARPVVIEWTHRVIAMVVGILAVMLVYQAIRKFRDRRAVIRVSIAALVLVVIQALLGRVVVKEELEVLLVVAHLLAAMLFLATLIVLSVMEVRSRDGIDQASNNTSFSRRAWLAAGAVLVLLLVGSYTSDFGYMPGWPFQHGRIVPNLNIEREAIHFVHRSLAVIVGVIVAFVLVDGRRRASSLPTSARKLSQLAGALFAVELLLGAANVWTTLHPIVVTLHLATGALVWACLVGAWATTSRAVWLAATDRVRLEAAPSVAEVRG